MPTYTKLGGYNRGLSGKGGVLPLVPSPVGGDEQGKMEEQEERGGREMERR